MKRLIVFLSFIICTISFGETTHFQVGLTPTLNILEGDKVTGLRIPVFFAKTEKVTGMDFNLFASEVDEITGYQGGIFMGAGIYTRVNKRFRGLGFSIVNLHGGDSKGMLVGIMNITNDFKGLKLGLINYSRKRSGWEVGVINNSEEAFFQLGLINMTDKIDGLQIGLVNIAKNGVLPVMPLVNFNWSL